MMERMENQETKETQARLVPKESLVHQLICLLVARNLSISP